MRINKVIDYYNKAYFKAARGRETGRGIINNLKKIMAAEKKPMVYRRLKNVIMRLISGRLYWPSVWPTSIDPESGAVIYSLVRLLKPEAAIEIGTFKGYTTICIAQALEDNKKGKLYTIDPIEQEITKIAIKKSGLKRRINYIIDYSTEVIPKLNLSRLDFVFIDGDHSYESCLADFNVVKPYLRSGSTVVFHDSILFPEGVGGMIQSIIDSKEFEVIVLPTLSGADKHGRAVLSTGNVKDFVPAGLTICRKRAIDFDFDIEEEFNKNNNKKFEEGERLYLGYQLSKEIVKEHLDRYEFAKNYLKPNFVVLDAACGTGYGSEILAGSVKKVIGLEISKHALDWANKHYQKPNIEFREVDINKPLDLPNNYFDAVVSFETLEHVVNQENMLSEFKRVLKPKGLLIISTPDREIITDKAGTINKFHIKELSKKEFLLLLSKYFQLDSLYGQMKHIPLSSIKKTIKLIAKLDIFGIRHWIERTFKLRNYIHQLFTSEAFSDIEKLNPEDQNNYFNLIAVAKNDK